MLLREKLEKEGWEFVGNLALHNSEKGIKIPIAASCGVFLMFTMNQKSLQAVGY